MVDPGFFCKCTPSRYEVACLLGPDSSGDFTTAEVPSSFPSSNSCDFDSCVCTDNPKYVQISEERLMNAVSFGKLLSEHLEQNRVDPKDIPAPKVEEPEQPVPRDEDAVVQPPNNDSRQGTSADVTEKQKEAE